MFQICDEDEKNQELLIYILCFVGLGVVMLFTTFFQVNIDLHLFGITTTLEFIYLEFSIFFVW